MPKLSIMLPTYNRADYLRECLDSLLTTKVDCEVLVSDNASTDGTEDVMRSYTDPRIRYFRQETNLGAFGNYNFLLSQATGEYLCLFGDDDRALPNCFDRKVALLDACPEISLVHSRTAPIGPDGERRGGGMVLGQLDYSFIGGRDTFQDLLINCFISWQTMVFRREIYEEIGPMGDWGLLASDDWYFVQQCVRNREVAYIVEPTVELRIHPGSYSVSTCIGEGYFMKDRMTLWRKWLLECNDPPIVTELMWSRMAAVVRMDVEQVHGPNSPKLEEALTELIQLNDAYRTRMEARFHLAEAQALTFRPGMAPWPLDGRKGTAFLHTPTWGSPKSEAAIAAYCRAFTPDDDTTLVLWLDPAQGVSEDQAAAHVMAAMMKAGVSPDACPDLLLVPDALNVEEQARLYTAVDCVVPLDDTLQADGARRVGTPVLKALKPGSLARRGRDEDPSDGLTRSPSPGWGGSGWGVLKKAEGRSTTRERPSAFCNTPPQPSPSKGRES